MFTVKRKFNEAVIISSDYKLQQQEIVTYTK